MALWVTLVLVDAVSVATFARCFTGPGELVLLIPVCLLAHAVAHLGRIVRRTNPAWSSAIWLLGVVLVAWVPVAALDWHSLTWGLPLGRSQHLLAGQFHVAWKIFSDRVAPVTESPALVLAAAWAAGAVGLAAEALDADATLPAIVALVPAFDIVVFTGTLGTTTARGPELAVLAALGVAYLAGTARQAKGEQIVTARVEGSAVSGGRRFAAGALAQSMSTNGSGRSAGERSAGAGERGLVARWRRQGLRGVAAPGLVALAALSAGVIGPLLPGATSAPLVAWHGGPSGGDRGRNGHGSGRSSGSITISNLVQVAEQEIDNPNVPLFTEYGPEKTREVLATLDTFNGNQWLPGPAPSLPQDAERAVARFRERLSVRQLEAHPDPLGVSGGTTSITEVISVSGLGSNELPVPGTPVGIDKVGNAVIAQNDGAVLVPSDLYRGETYVVKADLNPGWDVARQHLQEGPSGAPAVDTSLPRPVPASITALASQWTRGASNPVAKALLIQDHLTGGDFRYALPRSVPSASDSPSAGYAELENFLFHTRTGYCQQFASAFAVLARIEGLPARVVVGVLPGTRVGTEDAWRVTGTEVHAWPQVYFKGTGWVDFEPTPGSPAPVVPPSTTVTPSSIVSSTTTPGPVNNHFTRKPGPAGGGSGSTGGRSGARKSGGSGVLDLLLALVAAVALWAFGVPAWRLPRLRREERDPLRGVLAEWRASVRILAAAGFHRRRAETFDEFAGRVRLSGVLPKAAETALTRLVKAMNHATFGKAPPTVEEMNRAVSDASLVRRATRKHLTWWRQILIQVDPRDLLRMS